MVHYITGHKSNDDTLISIDYMPEELFDPNDMEYLSLMFMTERSLLKPFEEYNYGLIYGYDKDSVVYSSNTDIQGYVDDDKFISEEMGVKEGYQLDNKIGNNKYYYVNNLESINKLNLPHQITEETIKNNLKASGVNNFFDSDRKEINEIFIKNVNQKIYPIGVFYLSTDDKDNDKNCKIIRRYAKKYNLPFMHLKEKDYIKNQGSIQLIK